MSDLTVSPDLMRPAPAAPSADARRMRETAQQFEAAFLSQMLKPMFEGLSTEGPFGGGEAEATWRSFMIDAMAQQTARAGGVGVSAAVMNEMIKLQADQTGAAG